MPCLLEVRGKGKGTSLPVAPSCLLPWWSSDRKGMMDQPNRYDWWVVRRKDDDDDDDDDDDGKLKYSFAALSSSPKE